MLPTPDVLWSFALVAALLTITPGLDTALTLRTAALAGRRRAWGVVAGIQTGTLVWGALAAAGVSALLLASQLAYDVLRYLGAAYLAYLGIRMLVSAMRRRPLEEPEVEVGRHDTVLSGWRQGLLTNVLNPKVGAFYVAILPGLIPAGAPQVAWGVALAGVHCLMGAAWSTLLVLAVGRFREVLRRPRVARTVDGVAGVAMIGFGVRLATESRHA